MTSQLRSSLSGQPVMAKPQHTRAQKLNFQTRQLQDRVAILTAAIEEAINKRDKSRDKSMSTPDNNPIVPAVSSNRNIASST